MSKYVKDLMTSHVRNRLEGVQDLLVVDVIGMDANSTTALRKRLREKDIQLMVVKNSLARRATEGTPLGPAFDEPKGSMAVVWGGEDIVFLAKEVVDLAGNKEFGGLEARGGVMDGAAMTADDVKQVSKWPSRGEQLSILVGQILSPGATLQSQLLGPGEPALASQIKEKGGGDEEPAGDE